MCQLPAMAARGRNASKRAAPEPESMPALDDMFRMGMSLIGPGSQGNVGAAMSSASSASTATEKKAVDVNVLPDGRLCQLCNVPDSDPDLVHAKASMKWGYPPDKASRKNVGRVCYYCTRVWTARFKSKFKQVEKLIAAFGSDMELMGVFQHWRKIAVELMQRAGSYDVTVQWGDEKNVKELMLKKSRETCVSLTTLILFRPTPPPSRFVSIAH